MSKGLAGMERGRIVRAALWAAAGALMTLLVVLPAVYGIDPTGFGAVTGLTRADDTATMSAAAGAPISADASGEAPPLNIWSVSHPGKYRTQTFEVPLRLDEELEYKALVNRGEPLLYSWRVKEGTQVYFEFHGEPTEGTWRKDYYQSYEKGESSAGQGSMVAPFTGRHGWFWLNIGDTPITIEVELSGYYSDFSRFGAGRTAQ